MRAGAEKRRPLTFLVKPQRRSAFRAAFTHGKRSADSIPAGNSASAGIKMGKPFLMGNVAWHPEQTSDTCSRASVASRSGSSGQRRLARKASSMRRLYGGVAIRWGRYRSSRVGSSATRLGGGVSTTAAWACAPSGLAAASRSTFQHTTALISKLEQCRAASIGLGVHPVRLLEPPL